MTARANSLPHISSAPTKGKDSDRANNFDLIRLFGALQVAVVHATEHLHAVRLEPLVGFLGYLPGVPIFFTVSGFLVSLSLERARSVRQYSTNRALRIFPGLWACVALSFLMVVAAGIELPHAGSVLSWFAAQFTIAQFYNPPWLRGFGVGVLNGSLWTIPVELQFYAALPLLAWWAGRRSGRWALLAVVAGTVMVSLRTWGPPRTSLLGKFLSVSLAPYLFFFLVGILLRYAYEKHPAYFRGRALWWALVYAAWVCVEIIFGIPGSTGNLLNIGSIALLSTLVVSAAFSSESLSGRLLGTTDISYGLYIYHMPVVNLALVNGVVGPAGVACALLVSIGLAILSWKTVERPALGLKRYSIKGRAY
ncbi:MAG TPA: acyltransferase [Gemmatimonadaceae bacterium]|nr:acyltransferase [Gemmatimonadaceae bacterium]